MQPLVVVRRRQPDVDDRDVGRVAAHLEQQFVGVRRTGRRPRTRPRRAAAPAPRAAGRCPRRSLRARNLRLDARSAALRRPDAEPAAEGLDAIRKPAQTRTSLACPLHRCRRRRSRRAGPRVSGRPPRLQLPPAHASPTLARLSVDDVVGRDLDLLRQAPVDLDPQPHGDSAQGPRPAPARRPGRDP